MRLSKCLIFLCLCLGLLCTICLGQSQGNAATDRWTMVLREVASREIHKRLVQLAEANSDSNVVRTRRFVGEWVPVLKRNENHIEDIKENIESVVTRRNSVGVLELLVLISDDDLTEANVAEIRCYPGYLGKLWLGMRVDKRGTEKFAAMTRRIVPRLRGQPVRCIALITDGRVRAAVAVNSIYGLGAVIIPGDFTEAEIDDMVKRYRPKVKAYAPLYPRVIVRLVLIFAAVVVGLIVIIFGSLPAPGLKASKPPAVWTLATVTMGIIMGGYLLGVTKHFGPVDILGSESAVGIITHVALLWVLIGGALGAAVGFVGGRILLFLLRRALHNAKRICGLTRKTAGQAETGR